MASETETQEAENDSESGPFDAEGGRGRTTVRSVYDGLSADYDRRWAHYIERTTRAALAHMALRRDETVLDVGCGTGALLARANTLVPGERLSGVDLSPAMLDRARAQLPSAVGLSVADATALPFDDGVFDVAASCNVFHYIPQPQAALAEMVRVVRPGGRLVVTDWCHDYLACRLLEWWLRRRDPAHHRTYGARELTAMVAASGCSGVRCQRYRVDWWWGMMTVTGYKG